jgi:hypothetical protein
MTMKIAHVVFSLIIVAASGFWNVALRNMASYQFTVG